ncbi:MAG TPA: hypothetical protein VEJ18_21170 [Planctomycetota bacterium]|nr:hypothetical protein [Planctomycetota bacterium]
MPESTATLADPSVIDDLRLVERTARHFIFGGLRPEFWEAYTLLRTDRAAYLAEAERLERARKGGGTAAPSPELMENLRLIRRDYHPLTRPLRGMIERLLGTTDGLQLEFLLVLIMGSARGRETAMQWIADPAAHERQAKLRLRAMSKLVDAYRKALMEHQRQAPPPPAGDAAGGPPALQPPPRLAEDVRSSRKILEILDGMKPPARLWEILGLLMARRAETTQTALELHRLRRDGQPGEFAGTAFRFRERIDQVRQRYGTLVQALHEFVHRLLEEPPDPTLEEVVVASLVVASAGRQRGRQWLEDPSRARAEALAYVDAVRARLEERPSRRAVAVR